MDQGTTYARAPDEKIAWGSSLPYILLHVLAVVGLFYFPPTWELVLVAVGAYYLRMFGITAGYHRYFSHRSYKTGRVFQFILALLGSFSSQKGVLWWAGHHRHHHKHSDQPEDIHSPKRGFWWAHHLWILCPKYDETPFENIRDFAKFPELRFLNRTWLVWPFVFGGLLALIGGPAWAFWGGLLSTVVLWHGTFTINSLTHLWGSVRYATTDTSKNSFILALVTMGEGWHNNHHFYQSTANQGFYWWEVDMSYYILKVLSWFGVVKDLRTPPQWVLDGGERRYPQTQGRPGTQPELQVAGTFAFPAALVETMQSLAALRDEAATKKHLLTRLGPLAADAAEKAADVAQKAAVAATEASAAAVDLKAKLAVAAAEAADRAAALAREASDAAVEAAESVKDRAAQTWADSATKAAEAAAEAAASAQAVRAEIAA